MAKNRNRVTIARGHSIGGSAWQQARFVETLFSSSGTSVRCIDVDAGVIQGDRVAGAFVAF